ncbi:hypothetical protein AXF42_Ash002004 [Apostasia shenzhenica]|uniref:Uncharacterized protein n=1 Tax=Apostasia shenzhenica TaxID=1088818 RepID=A0A2I0ABU4_9ASPA|nr:hypothetical protein AXF42_Ash002004 [Apostasia shenzhenica]
MPGMGNRGAARRRRIPAICLIPDPKSRDRPPLLRFRALGKLHLHSRLPRALGDQVAPEEADAGAEEEEGGS